MMHTIWMRLFVTSLMLLGDYAYSSEFDSHFDVDIAACDNSIQSYQSAALDVDGTGWVPGHASDDAIRPRFVFAPQTIKSVISPFPNNSHKYNSLNPRAPPVLFS